MRIRLGLTHPSSAWEQLAQQEGISSVVVDLASEALNDECSLLAVAGTLTRSEQETVQGYLRRGGAIIGYVRHLHGLTGCDWRQERIEYIVADHDHLFPDIHLLDLAVDGAIPREANSLRTQSNTFAVFAGSLGGGYAVLLPFDPGAILHDDRALTKGFHGSLERLPTERVSAVSKGEVRQLLRRSFEFLHRVRGIPYAHLWYFPDGRENLFAFRIDSDGAPRQDVDDLYQVARDHKTPMSWYLDVKSHEQWLQRFCNMEGQEIGVHCYEHVTYNSTEDNLENIRRARRLMESVGLRPEGYTAPYGIWHPRLARAIDQGGFAYSSEFSFAYDTLPFYPESDGTQFHALQVPIHPICPGSLRRVGYTDGQMIDHYRALIHEKLCRQEPLFFYHHPTHKSRDVLRFLFQHIHERGIGTVTLGEFARWWKHRLSTKLDVRADTGKLTVAATNNGGEGRPWLRIVRPSGEEAVVPIADEILLDRVSWRPRQVVPPPDDIRRIREFDPRARLGDLYTRLIRKFT